MKTQYPNEAPAFPLGDSCCDYGGTNRSDANGMGLRDYFAAKAMQAILAPLVEHGSASEPEIAPIISQAAYFMADAMMKERLNHG